MSSGDKGNKHGGRKTRIKNYKTTKHYRLAQKGKGGTTAKAWCVMADKELREAAARLSAWHEWAHNHYEPPDADPYRDDKSITQCKGQHAEDKEELALAYLAEHPSDSDDPVTEAWLRSIGANKDDHPVKWTFRRSDAMSIGLWHVDDGWKVMLIHSEHHQSCIVRGLKTRGDVRRLCKALGIELKA